MMTPSPPLLSFFRRNVASELAKAGRSGGGGPEAYHGAVTLALEQLAPYRDDIEASISTQGPLLAEILTLNERCVVRIWDVLQ